MLPDAAYKPTMSISIPPERRHVFYASLARFRQRYPFITKNGLVVQAVLEATQTEQQLIELLAHLPQAVRITQQGSVYLWECPADQGSALTLLEATKQALTTLLGTAPSPETDPSVSLASTQEQAYSTESKHTA